MKAIFKEVAAEPELLKRFVLACAKADGLSPFSDQALLGQSRVFYWLLQAPGAPDDPALLDLAALTVTESELSNLTIAGIALASASTLELAIAPHFRGRGLGASFAAALRRQLPEVKLFWAHGSHPAAARLARRYDASVKRQVVRMRLPELDKRPFPEIPPHSNAADKSKPVFRAFRPGQAGEPPTADELNWLKANADIFADHPEQGQIDLAALRSRCQQDWFLAENFLLAERQGRLVGYVWLKTLPGRAEVYVLGVLDKGKGLGLELMNLALDKLHQQGFSAAELYTESDNLPALKLYQKLGFEQVEQDTLYEVETGSHGK